VNEKDIKQLSINYKTTFGSESGNKVLEDLKKRCGFETTSFVQGDSHDTAFREGQRAVVLFINNMLNKKEK
tara:strand:+ start:98 stop:310 length:213 start_codon:yes stop_codon:yes gene_type:complete